MNPSDWIAIIAIITASMISIISVVCSYRTSIRQNQLMEKTIMLNKQPYLSIEIEMGYITAAIDNGRRWLNIHYKLKNIGDSPAISIYCCAHFELQHTSHNDSVKVNIDDSPHYIHSLGVGNNEEVILSFENKEIKLLIKDVEQSYNMNMDRIRTDPYKEHYKNTILETEIYFCNVLGQWFKITNRAEILEIVEANPEMFSLESIIYKKIHPETDEEEQFTRYKELYQKMEKIPPNTIKQNLSYSLHFVNPCFYNSSIVQIDAEKARLQLSEYGGSSELFRVLDNQSNEKQQHRQ